MESILNKSRMCEARPQRRRCSLQQLAASALTLVVSGLLSMGLMQPAKAQAGRRAVKVAAVDFIPAWGVLEGNIRRLAQAAERVAA